ncbi:MAG: spondin domain-containing protein [Bacteroidota bacterium]|nr:spondin domain-containing protein [Bacteroidota bacterium]
MKKLLLVFFGIPLIFISCKKHDHYPPHGKQFTLTIENVSQPEMYLSSGVINTPVGDASPGPLTPGKKYEFMVKAGKGQKLSFAVMLAATNDLFFAPDDNGIVLYDNNGDPISSQDVTNQIHLYDAGTEVNEEPAVGPNTVTNQSGPNTGITENGVVQDISKVTTDHFNYPAVNTVINVMIKYMSGYNFMVTIEDVSTNMALQTSKGDFAAPLSPGVWVIHMGSSPLFTSGQPDRGNGLEAIAEDGNTAPLGQYVADNTGLNFPVSPGVWAVHKDGTMPIFKQGAKDFGQGLERIAEDANPTDLGMSLMTKLGVKSSGVFAIPEGAAQPGAIGPGMKYQFSFSANEMDRLSFATMFGQSNDLFYAPGDKGVPLFQKGKPVTGDITSQISLWDVGTEKNEEPGYGPNQVQRQSAPNTGTTESNPIDIVNDGFTYPSTNNVIKVTLSYN